MKPWERNDLVAEETPTSSAKPWERDDLVAADEEVNLNRIPVTNELSGVTNYEDYSNPVKNPDGTLSTISTIKPEENKIIPQEDKDLEEANKKAQNQGDFPIEYVDSFGVKQTSNTPGQALEDTSFDIAMMTPTKLGVLDYLPSHMKTRLLAPTAEEQLSKQAKVLLHLDRDRISYEEALKQLRGIPKDEQVITLAESMDIAKNYFKSTVKDDAVLASKLGRRLEQRKQVFEPFIANEQDLVQAKQTFGEMKKVVEQESKGNLHISAIDDLDRHLDDLAEIYKTDPSGLGTAVKQIKADLGNGDLTPSVALDIRENINAILRKPSINKSHKSRQLLGDIKLKIDSYIDKTVSPEVKQLIDKEVNKYRQTINNKQFGDIIEKNTKADYAVDWDKVIKDLKKEGLSSENIEMALPVLKQYSKRFHNDKYMANVITPEGDMDNLNALGVQSKILSKVLDILSPLYSKSRHKGAQIRGALEKAMKKGGDNSSIDFVEELVKRKTITKGEAAELQEKIRPLMLEYKQNAKTTGDVNVEPIATPAPKDGW